MNLIKQTITKIEDMEYPDKSTTIANQEISHIHFFNMDLKDWKSNDSLELLDDIIQRLANPKILIINHEHLY